MNINPTANSRSIAVGTTGSGKTTLEKSVIRSFPFVLAIDPKPSLGLKTPRGYLPGFALCRSPDELYEKAKKYHWLQYRPDPQFHNDETFDAVYMWAYNCGNRFIATDELYLVHTNGRAGPGLMACMTSGRERGIGMFHCTQRPVKIDQRCISECEYFYVFQLRKQEDRERMADCASFPELKEMVTGHNFWYVGPTSEEAVITSLSRKYL